MNAQELLEAAKTRTGLSQSGLAAALGLRQPTLSQWNAGKAELSDETYIKLAKLAGVDPAEIIIEKHMRKAGPEGQKIWAHLARTLPKSAALLLVIILIVPNIQAHAASFQNFNVIKCLLCKVLEWVSRAVKVLYVLLIQAVQTETRNANPTYPRQAIR